MDKVLKRIEKCPKSQICVEDLLDVIGVVEIQVNNNNRLFVGEDEIESIPEELLNLEVEKFIYERRKNNKGKIYSYIFIECKEA